MIETVVYYIYDSKISCVLINRTLKVFRNYIFVAAEKIVFKNL